MLSGGGPAAPSLLQASRALLATLSAAQLPTAVLSWGYGQQVSIGSIARTALPTAGPTRRRRCCRRRHCLPALPTAAAAACRVHWGSAPCATSTSQRRSQTSPAMWLPLGRGTTKAMP